MIKVQININMILKIFLPDRFANFLIDALIVPTTWASQVPFRMIAIEVIHCCAPFMTVVF